MVCVPADHQTIALLPWSVSPQTTTFYGDLPATRLRRVTAVISAISGMTPSVGKIEPKVFDLLTLL